MKNLILKFHPALSIIFISLFLQTGIAYSQWTNISGGFPPGIFAVSSAVQGISVYAGVNNGVLVSDANGLVWTRILGNTGYINTIAFSGNYLFAGSGGSGIYITSNGGVNWSTALSSSIWSLSSSAGSVYAVVFADRVYKSTDNGNEWLPLSPSGNVRCVYADEPYVFAGIYNYTSGGNGGVYFSSNSGANWSRTLADINIYSIAGKNETIYAGATDDTSRTGGVYVSSDHGLTWIRSSLDSISAKTLYIYNNYVFAGVDNSFYPGFTEYAGFWISADRGQTWYKRNEGFPSSNTAVYSISVLNNTVFAVASDGGLWKRPVSQVIGVKNINSEIPAEFKLSQNYPNPFNPVTNLEFGIPDLGFVSLKVYDIIGKEIIILVNEKLSPGKYKVEFDGSGLMSGVYFYKLTAGDFTDTKRMMLIK